jgi:hypothetical protein
MKAIERLKRIVKKADEEWQKRIDSEPNIVVRQLKQDFKDLSDLERKLEYFELMYGIELQLKIPKTVKGPWGQSVVDLLASQGDVSSTEKP